MKRVAGILVSAVLTWLIAPHLFAEFAGVRHKIVRTAIPAAGNVLDVPFAVDARPENRRTGFVAISRIRNDGTAPLVVRVRLDDRDVCAAEIPAGKSRRLNCPVGWAWALGATKDAAGQGRPAITRDHTVEFSGTATSYTVESFELATHYGALTPGPRDLIVGPPGMTATQTSPAWHIGLIVILMTLSAWSIQDRRLPRWLAAVHLTASAVVVVVVAIVIAAGWLSQYSLLIAHEFLEQLLVLTALPAIVGAAISAAELLRRSGRLPLARVIGAGLIVGVVFLSFVRYRTESQYEGNASGLILISRVFFDQSPMATDGSDVQRALLFSGGNGYDGQFFYYMAFDPFLRTFRSEPQQYDRFIDLPPYRYGRIGYSLLARGLSGGRPERYPIAMIALVIVALAACGSLLAAIARRLGSSEWCGLLVLFVPGFWRSAESALPEPLAIAFVLAAYLCLVREKWWGCGALLGMALLVRETSGALAVAVVASVWLLGKRRETALVGLLAFLPIVLWKCFVAWVFWPGYGVAGLMPHPDDVGWPLVGVWDLWSAIARGQFFDGWRDMIRSAVLYPIMTTAAAGLAVVGLVKRPSPMAAAAVFYAVLVLTFNYRSVWLSIPNAERLSIDLFIALLLVVVQRRPADRGWATPLTLFWTGAVCYVLFGMWGAGAIRESVLGRIVPGY